MIEYSFPAQRRLISNLFYPIPYAQQPGIRNPLNESKDCLILQKEGFTEIHPSVLHRSRLRGQCIFYLVVYCFCIWRTFPPLNAPMMNCMPPNSGEAVLAASINNLTRAPKFSSEL